MGMEGGIGVVNGGCHRFEWVVRLALGEPSTLEHAFWWFDIPNTFQIVDGSELINRCLCKIGSEMPFSRTFIGIDIDGVGLFYKRFPITWRARWSGVAAACIQGRYPFFIVEEKFVANS